MEERRGPLSGGGRVGMDPENRIGRRTAAGAFPVFPVFPVFLAMVAQRRVR
jgi:hypothetical protein